MSNGTQFSSSCPLGSNRRLSTLLHSVSRMWRNRDDRNLLLLGTVAPKDAIRSGRLILSVCFEDLLFLIVGVFDRGVLVGLQAGMPRVAAQQVEGLVDLFEDSFVLP